MLQSVQVHHHRRRCSSVSVSPPRDLMNKCGHRYKFIKNGLKALAVLKGAAPRAGGSVDGPTRAGRPDPHPNTASGRVFRGTRCPHWLASRILILHTHRDLQYENAKCVLELKAVWNNIHTLIVYNNRWI